MKIFFDHQIFTEQKTGGISRYFKSLIDGLEQEPLYTYKIGSLVSDNHYLKDVHLPLQAPFYRFLFKSSQKTFKRNNSYTKHLIKKNQFDLFHATYFYPPFLKHLKKPLVVTVHDMTYEVLPEYFQAGDPLPLYKRQMMEAADKIIAVSEHTKKDILRYSNIPEKKIEVIHHGISADKPVYEDIPALPEDFILFVGGRSGYKNFFLFAEAFTRLVQKNPFVRLVLAGGGAIQTGEKEYFKRHNIENSVFHISATDGQLNTLYKKARFFVYPSLYEGFGLPILEAYKNNCPVLLSEASCFEEIASNAAVYFPPKSVDALLEKMEDLWCNATLRDHLIHAGNQRLVQFPLNDCVKKTLALYKSIL